MNHSLLHPRLRRSVSRRVTGALVVLVACSGILAPAAIAAARATSGAQKVSLVGYSQGSALARYWANKVDKGQHTATVVRIGTPTRGATVQGLTNLIPYLPPQVRDFALSLSLLEPVAGSEFVTMLNEGGELL